MPHHGHSHGHCGGEADHSHDHSDAEMGKMYSLFQKVDTERVQCLNEVVDGSGKTVFKAWDQRKDKEKFVESDADEELLFNIPFTGSVKLKGIILIGDNDDSHPATMRLFKNKPGMTFDDTGMAPEQEFELHPDPEGVLEYNTKVARFNNVNHLSIHIPRNFGSAESADASTRVYYIGLRGDFSEVNRQEVVICNYEASANPADHKTDTFDTVGHMVS
ncbi:PITH domain-containing protein 1-like [Babylonia areolata]|uniref:PITH domain-containing protein 1-like n=1 Tax=Babylonia areolata TaxID=304850 RepID=UPI003FD398B3